MTISKVKLEQFREQLVTRREALAADLRAATSQLINDEVSYTDSVDQAAAETDKSFTLQMKNRDRNILWQIDEAIRRIADGSYGGLPQFLHFKVIVFCSKDEFAAVGGSDFAI